MNGAQRRSSATRAASGPPAGRTADSELIDQLLEFNLNALAGCAAMAGAGGQQRTGFFGGRGLDAPFFDPRHHHPGMK